MLDPAAKFLYSCLERHLNDNAFQWFSETVDQVKETAEKIFVARFSAVPRYLGKADLDVSDAEKQTAAQIHPNWNLQHWSVDQAGRAVLILAWAAHHPDSYVSTVAKLFSAADVGELVALYQVLPLLPQPDVPKGESASHHFLNQALDGIRTNMTAVFHAIALNNSYPAQHFSEDAWNQLVLKALFVGSPLHPIVGLDRRANPKLSRMLSDYAHERWAAGRSINPELWRVAAPFLEVDRIGDLAKLLASTDEQEQKAGALACASCPLPDAKDLLAQVPHLQQQIQRGELSWDFLSAS
ncbi:EboA domain-containing protein [Microcoleus sp. FACHB-1515]|uniref:EboA domain-containing protein n=1 Tax=Microcoleus sp. FACHB-1515 TaxID=2692821 RepID=UPI0018EFFCC9|nr:EboA domain-containing protein [Microcoleus sp. FACHB-1515]